MVPSLSGLIVDVHCHVGLRGDVWPELGRLGPRFLDSPASRVFMAYARVPPGQLTDPVLRAKTEEVLSETTVDHVVCLALDQVHDEDGTPRPDLTSMFVSDEYVIALREAVGPKVLLGASVHPYAPDFADRVRRAVDRGAVLLKWLPSAQAIDLASPRAAEALRLLARLGPNGGPLPLLLHTGAEYAVPPAEPGMASLDFHSWSRWDAFWNLFRGSRRWRVPDVRRVARHVRQAVEEGAIIIFAHCGLPYFVPRGPWGWAEHSDFSCVQRYLEEDARLGPGQGRYLADVSACCTPFRQGHFGDIARLPADAVLFGSDFPTPVFELSADLAEAWRDFRAVLDGELERVIVPQDNLLDVNLRELERAFPGHAMFSNFGTLWDTLTSPGGSEGRVGTEHAEEERTDATGS